MHFLSKLHNNSILTGSVDSYCLVCDSYLRSEDEAFTHTEKPIHKKNMGMAARVEKFLGDRIIKVKKGYYCPFCNILLTTTTKVTIHIGDPSHQEIKGAQMLTRIGNNIIAFDEVAITLESWHGLMDNTCVICNTEFDDNMHRTDLGHVLRLVQSRCEFGDRYIYRKVDEDSFYCLICASVFSINEKLKHHENVSHKNLYSSGKELKKKIPPKIQEPKKNTPNLVPVKARDTKKSIDDNFGKEKTEKTVINKVDISKTEIKQTQNPVKDLIMPVECKIKVEVSKDKEDKEVFTLLQNSAHACSATAKPENVIEEMSSKKIDRDRHSEVLDRLDEFQKKGINIDFTWDRARCKLCGDNVTFSTAAIEKHIEQHTNIKQISTEVKVNSEQQKKSDDSNDVKTGTRKVEPKSEKIKDNIEPIPEKQIDKLVLKIEKQIDNIELNTEKKRENNAESGSDKNKTDNIVERKTDIKKLEKVVEEMQDTKKQRNTSESSIDVKTTQKTENGIQPKLTKKQRKKSKNLNEINTGAKEINNVTAPTDKKKTNNEVEPKDSKNEQKPDTKKELEKLAQKNNMVVMPNEVYCPQCKVGTDLTTAAINAHAHSINHKERNTNQNEIFGKRVQTECMETFIQVESNLGSDIILNNKYVLRHHSFHCIVIEDDGYNCMLCNVFFKKTGEVNLHMNGPDHKNKLSLCKVVTSMPEEFVREITPDIYHCGYCNDMFEGWTEMQDHLSDILHHYARRHAQWNLERCHSVIRNTKLMQISSTNAINYA